MKSLILQNTLIDHFANEYKDDVINLNYFLANNPEISGEEFISSHKIVELIKKNNIEVEANYADHETSFKATINQGKKNKAAILVEYDALRGIGHGCGHCASGSMSILAGLILNELKDNIDAQVDIIGTPDEELRGHKAYMAQKGLFDDYDFVIMIHLNSENGIKLKLIALDGLKIEFFGKSSHAAQKPWEGKNALNAVRLLFDSVDMMRQHVKDDVRIHGFIENGGVASNIVPDYTSTEFCIRANKRSELNDITEWVKDCARAAALATRTEVKICQLGMPFDELLPNEAGENLLHQIYNDLNIELIENKIIEVGSSDIGNVSFRCPAFHPLLGIGKQYNLHSKEFADAMKSDEIESIITDGARIISRFVVNVYENDELLNRIKESYRLGD